MKPRFIYMGLVVLLLAVVLIGAHSSKDSLFTDELRSVEHLGGVYGTNGYNELLFSLIDLSSQHAPGYFLLIRLWTYLVGYSPFALRFLSILFGLIGIAWLYRLGRDLFNPTIGFYAAILLGTNVYYLFYTHEIRMYSLFIMLIIIEVWLYYRLMLHKSEPRVHEWLALFATTLALIMTHYNAIFPLMGLGIYHLLIAPKNRRWLMTAILVIASGITFLPWLPVVIRGTLNNSSARPWLTGLSFFRVMLEHTSNGIIVIVPILLIVTAVMTRRKASQLWYIWIVALVHLLAMFALNEYTPFVGSYRSARYYLALYPVFLLLAAYGLAALSRYRWLVVAVLMVWMVGGAVYAQTETFRYYNNRGIELGYTGYPPMSAISAPLYAHHLNSQQGYLLTLTNHPLVWRTQDEENYHLRLLHMPGIVMNAERLENLKTNNGDFGLIGMNDYRVNIFLGYSPEQIVPETVALAHSILDTTYERCETLRDDRMAVVYHYMRRPFDCTLTDIPEGPLVKYLEQNVILHDMRVIVRDGFAHVAGAWSADVTVPLHAYSVSLQVLDPQGEKVGQKDYVVQHSPGYWYISLFDTQEWASGTYTVEAVVYNWYDGERLTGERADGQRSTHIAAIEFEVP